MLKPFIDNNPDEPGFALLKLTRKISQLLAALVPTVTRVAGHGGHEPPQL